MDEGVPRTRSIAAHVEFGDAIIKHMGVGSGGAGAGQTEHKPEAADGAGVILLR